jgi:hypothetical protein
MLVLAVLQAPHSMPSVNSTTHIAFEAARSCGRGEGGGAVVGQAAGGGGG